MNLSTNRIEKLESAITWSRDTGGHHYVISEQITNLTQFYISGIRPNFKPNEVVSKSNITETNWKNIHTPKQTTNYNTGLKFILWLCLISTLLHYFRTWTVQLLWQGEWKYNGRKDNVVSSLIIWGTNHPVTLHHTAEE